MILQLVYPYISDIRTRVKVLYLLQNTFEPCLDVAIPSPESFCTQRRVFASWKRYKRYVRPHANSWVRRRRRTDDTPLMPFY